jgi:anti-anti-sigma regulatory factor
MNNADIFVAQHLSTFKVKVTGRATFAVGPAMRKLVQSLESESDKRGVTIDLTECTGMDSTFMGILAMLALKVRKDNITVKLVNAGDNKRLLDGLGLKNLFNYVNEEASGDSWHKTATNNTTVKESARTVLDAHKVLMKADEQNIDKFKNVVKMVEKELEE